MWPQPVYIHPKQGGMDNTLVYNHISPQLCPHAVCVVTALGALYSMQCPGLGCIISNIYIYIYIRPVPHVIPYIPLNLHSEVQGLIPYKLILL